MSLLGLKKEYHKEIKDAICQEKDKETNKLISNCEKKCNLKNKSKPKKTRQNKYEGSTIYVMETDKFIKTDKTYYDEPFFF